MIRMLSRSLLVLVATAQLPAAHAQAVTAPRPTDPSPDALTAQERDVLATAEQLAADTAQTLDQWLTTQAITQDRLFARLYFPVAKPAPGRYTTPYDALADRDLTPIENKALAHAPMFQYAIVTDINAYVPAHNTRFAQPLTGDAVQDYTNNRTKRFLSDPASLPAARSTARFLIQRVTLDSGDLIYDLSVPVSVHGKPWGCVRIGYRRTE